MQICPRCNEPLVWTKTGTGFVYACPRCGGRAVTLSVVRKLAPHECVKELWCRTNRPGANHGPGCPVCR